MTDTIALLAEALTAHSDTLDILDCFHAVARIEAWDRPTSLTCSTSAPCMSATCSSAGRQRRLRCRRRRTLRLRVRDRLRRHRPLDRLTHSGGPGVLYDHHSQRNMAPHSLHRSMGRRRPRNSIAREGVTYASSSTGRHHVGRSARPLRRLLDGPRRRRPLHLRDRRSCPRGIPMPTVIPTPAPAPPSRPAARHARCRQHRGRDVHRLPGRSHSPGAADTYDGELDLNRRTATGRARWFYAGRSPFRDLDAGTLLTEAQAQETSALASASAPTAAGRSLLTRASSGASGRSASAASVRQARPAALLALREVNVAEGSDDMRAELADRIERARQHADDVSRSVEANGAPWSDEFRATHAAELDDDNSSSTAGEAVARRRTPVR